MAAVNRVTLEVRLLEAVGVMFDTVDQILRYQRVVSPCLLVLHIEVSERNVATSKSVTLIFPLAERILSRDRHNIPSAALLH